MLLQKIFRVYMFRRVYDMAESSAKETASSQADVNDGNSKITLGKAIYSVNN